MTICCVHDRRVQAEKGRESGMLVPGLQWRISASDAGRRMRPGRPPDPVVVVLAIFAEPVT